MAKSADDPRSRRYQVGLPLETELFYCAQGEFIRNSSTTRAMEQFLMDRAKASQNVQELRDSILFRSELSGEPPVVVLETFLLKNKYNQVQGVDVPATAKALCKIWGLSTDEELGSEESEV
ncbi:hypothetical protein [Stenomitos frigidus]|uniref:hypothetical protein n=1 Tax=Stenomitos frigidus TaxID=1886765 RepID=UPI003299F28F